MGRLKVSSSSVIFRVMRRLRKPGSGIIKFRAYPSKRQAKAPIAQLKQEGISQIGQDASRVNRQRFGRAISPDRIESSFLSAIRGNMRDLTDISRETVDTDPHLGSVLIKRISAISSLPWEVIPATGFSVDNDKAEFYAEVVREQLKNMQYFRKFIMQISWALFDGRSIMECLWDENFTRNKNDGFGKISMILRSLGWVHPRRINFGPSRELLIQDETSSFSMGNFSPIGLDINKIPFKFLSWTPQRFGDYSEREGLAIRCMYWSFFKRFSARERMILVELYGKPWRIMTVDPDSPAGSEELTAADTIVDQLGASYSARLPRGVDLNVHNPQRSAGQVHKDVIDDSDKQISKLVLGQTGTTDAVPAGLNSKQANVMQDEQLMLLKTDAYEVSEILESMTDAIIILNFGYEEVINAPCVVLRSDLPADRTSELLRLKDSLFAGLEIARDEAYEVGGFRIPTEKDVIIKVDQPPTSPLSPVPPAPRAVIVHPKDQSPPAGEQQPITPTASRDAGASDNDGINVGSADIAKTIKVDEARAAQGKEPLGDERGEALVSQVDKIDKLEKVKEESEKTEEKKEEKKVEEENEEEIKEINEASKIEATIKKEDSKWVVYNEEETRSFGEYDTLEEAEARLKQIERFKKEKATKAYRRIMTKLQDHRSAVSMAMAIAEFKLDSYDAEPVTHDDECLMMLVVGQEQPESENGNPETILERGRFEIYKSMDGWVDDYVDSVEGLDSASKILSALDDASEDIDLLSMARPYERRMIQSLALGALDSNSDIAEDEKEEKIKEDERISVSRIWKLAAKTPDFSKMRFEDALRHFARLNVLTKSEFNRLSNLAKRRAFTVAGVQNQQTLALIKDELAKQIEKGADLRKFRKFIRERVKSAGFVATKIKGPIGTVLSASHTDTVYRTNVLNSYNAGRFGHMNQPKVKKARPVWEISVVRDSHTRKTHAAVHGKMLKATDPFWRKAYAPFGFNCFLPDSIIEGQVCGASKALYSGKAIQLTTSIGRRISVTANHPILTDQGFIAAQAIHEGDKLVCYGNEARTSSLGIASQRDENQAPSIVQDVFGALAESGNSLLSLYVGDDFHGEAKRFVGDIDVVGTYRELAFYRESMFSEDRENLVFEQSLPSELILMGRSLPDFSIDGNDAAFSGFPSGTALSVNQSRIATDETPFHVFRFGSASQMNVMLSENSRDNISADIILARELIDRSSGIITLDNVVDVQEFDFSGHVYDLHSPLGWIVASGIVTSNCRCRVKTRSSKYLSQVVAGDTIRGLPDRGFTSGFPRLL